MKPTTGFNTDRIKKKFCKPYNLIGIRKGYEEAQWKRRIDFLSTVNGTPLLHSCKTQKFNCNLEQLTYLFTNGTFIYYDFTTTKYTGIRNTDQLRRKWSIYVGDVNRRRNSRYIHVSLVDNDALSWKLRKRHNRS